MTTKTRAKKGLASKTPHFIESQTISPANVNILRGNSNTLDVDTAKSNYIKQFIDNEEKIAVTQPNLESSPPGSLRPTSKPQFRLPRLTAQASGVERRFMDYGEPE